MGLWREFIPHSPFRAPDKHSKSELYLFKSSKVVPRVDDLDRCIDDKILLRL